MADEKPNRTPLLGFALVFGLGLVFVLTRKSDAPATNDGGAAPAPSVIAGRASVALFDDGAPMVGHLVVFQSREGTILGTTKSGPDGKATGPMPSGGMITVAYGNSLKRLITVAGVEPNDEVLVGENENDEASSGDTATIANIGLPGAHPKAARYAVDLGVGSTPVLDAGASLRLPVLKRFLDESRHFEVLGLAYDADGGAVAYAQVEPSAADTGETDDRLPAWKSDWMPEDTGGLPPSAASRSPVIAIASRLPPTATPPPFGSVTVMTASAPLSSPAEVASGSPMKVGMSPSIIGK